MFSLNGGSNSTTLQSPENINGRSFKGDNYLCRTGLSFVIWLLVLFSNCFFPYFIPGWEIFYLCNLLQEQARLQPDVSGPCRHVLWRDAKEAHVEWTHSIVLDQTSTEGHQVPATVKGPPLMLWRTYRRNKGKSWMDVQWSLEHLFLYRV